MRYAPHSESVAKELLRAAGFSSLDDLFVDIPEEIRQICLLPESRGAAELAVRRQLEELALANESSDDSPIFIGAGCYDHYVPISVERTAASAGFLEASASDSEEANQRVLQAIYEFQTAICRLTGTDVANASLYCGGNALANACLLAAETTGRRLILIPETLNPDDAQIVRTFAASGLFDVRTVAEKGGIVDLDELTAILDADGADVAAVVVQYPNFFGNLERVGQIVAATKNVGALSVMSVDPIALAMLKSPGEWGADVAVGDAQPLGLSTSFGGPRLGFIAVTEALARRLPGRRVVETVDENGRRVFGLTLKDRKQTLKDGEKGEKDGSEEEKEKKSKYVSREKASSNVDSNETLGALTALAYLAFVGPLGLNQAANASHRIARYARAELKKAGFEFQHDVPFLREFAVKVDKPREMNRYLLEWGIIGGFELDDGLLLAFTEKRTREEVDELVYFMKNFQFGGAAGRAKNGDLDDGEEKVDDSDENDGCSGENADENGE